jgi:cell division protein FtsI/penicillin-binding protein 2
MNRRHAISLLMSSLKGAGAPAAALLVQIRTGRVLHVSGAEVAKRSLLPPGSTIKPFVLWALLRSGKLRADEGFLCPGRLAIGSRRFDCSHPPIDTPMRADTALAYSCNCFVAHVAERLSPAEFAAAAGQWGLTSRTGWMGATEIAGRVRRAASPDAVRLQALGSDGVLVTPAGLASAYCRLARSAGEDAMRPIIAGLEGAIEFGTAQLARAAGEKMAGKTGSVPGPHAWFAGFVPSRSPEVVVTVLAPGMSGGSDAAPAAARLVADWRAGRI